MFQSSRPVAGARIDLHRGFPGAYFCFNPRAPLPGRASLNLLFWDVQVQVSILAPRCRGAHPAMGSGMIYAQVFQSSRPVAGARIPCRWSPRHHPGARFNPRAPLPGRASAGQSRCRPYPSCFNPRAPLPGRASATAPTLDAWVVVSILAPRCRGAHLPGFEAVPLDVAVSILAPRCRGAHPW